MRCRNRNFDAMMAEYASNVSDQAKRSYTMGDFASIVQFAENKHPTQDGSGYLVKTHPALMAAVAFQIGYAAALRHEKRQAKRATE